MSDEEKKIARAATEAALLKQFKSDIGNKAVIEHHGLPPETEEYVDKLRDVLADVGQDLLAVGAAPKGFDYLGSFSVHVYGAEVTHQLAFLSLTNPHKTTHPLADAAMHKLTEDVNAHFTGTRRKLRSGW